MHPRGGSARSKSDIDRPVAEKLAEIRMAAPVTAHAILRMRQRAIPPDAIDLLSA